MYFVKNKTKQQQQQQNKTRTKKRQKKGKKKYAPPKKKTNKKTKNTQTNKTSKINHQINEIQKSHIKRRIRYRCVRSAYSDRTGYDIQMCQNCYCCSS
jgi:hypothetical protein